MFLNVSGWDAKVHHVLQGLLVDFPVITVGYLSYIVDYVNVVVYCLLLLLGR